MVENLFNASLVNSGFLKAFKQSHVDKELLVNGAVQIALDNLLCRDFTIQFLLFVNKYYNRETLSKFI